MNTLLSGFGEVIRRFIITVGDQRVGRLQLINGVVMLIMKLNREVVVCTSTVCVSVPRLYLPIWK